MDCRPPGSSVHGILQTRILEWIAIPFYRGSSWLRDITQFFCIAGRFFTIWATRKAPKKVPYFPSNWYAILHTRQHLNICSCGSIFSSAFGVVRVLDFGHFNRCVVVCDCCFNLHFPGDICCGLPFVYLFAICISSLVKFLLKSLAHFYSMCLFSY